MDKLISVISTALPVFLALAIGMMCRSKGFLTRDGVDTLKKVIVNLTLPDIKSEVMLHFLDARGICVSSGSACSTHAKSVSRALLAFGATEREADCSLRVSLSSDNTPEEVDLLLGALSEGLGSLIRIK